MSGRAVLIVAGGTGTRMQSPTAKQFIELGGKPIIMHTFEAFYRFDPHMQFVLVLYPGLFDQWNLLCKKYNMRIAHTLTGGGVERFHSVQNGLSALGRDVRWVAIHDAVRPLVSQETIRLCFEGAVSHGAAVPTIPVTDTVRMLGDAGSTTLPRNKLVAVQTPQCFGRALITEAYRADFLPIFTDDAAVVEFAGRQIYLTPGNRSNIKITSPEDLTIAEALLKPA